MDTRGVSGEGVEDLVPMIQRVYSQRQSKKIKPFIVPGGKSGVVKMMSLVSH